MANYIIADNQELTYMGLEAIIMGFAPGNISKARDRRQLLELLNDNELQTVVIDYTLFDFEDVEQFLVVMERYPATSWVLISDELADASVRRLIYASPRLGLVFKDSPVASIQAAIDAANNHTRYICQQATEMLLEYQHEDEAAAKLTPTEIAVVQAIAQGKTTKEIAADRRLSIHTVNTHRKNIFRKLGVNTAHETIRYALRAGLVDSADFYI